MKFAYFLSVTLLLTMSQRLPIQKNTELPSQNKEPLTHGYSILTLNTWGLPIWYPKSDKKNRYKNIANKLASSDFHFICLQEVFDRNLVEQVKSTLELTYESATDYKCTRRAGGIVTMDCNGGLMTWSKFPILSEAFYKFPVYNSMKFEEKIGMKGFLLSTISTPNGIINVVNTHLYSGQKLQDERHRQKQMVFIKSTLESTKEYNLYPTILAGDLNIQHPSLLKEHEKDMFSQVYALTVTDMLFNDFDTLITEDELTYDRKSNKYASKKSLPQKLDYLLFRNTNDIVFEEFEHRVVFKNDSSLSDHNGFVTTFGMTICYNKAIAVLDSSKTLFAQAQTNSFNVGAKD